MGYSNCHHPEIPSLFPQLLARLVLSGTCSRAGVPGSIANQVPRREPLHRFGISDSGFVCVYIWVYECV